MDVHRYSFALVAMLAGLLPAAGLAFGEDAAPDWSGDTLSAEDLSTRGLPGEGFSMEGLPFADGSGSTSGSAGWTSPDPVPEWRGGTGFGIEQLAANDPDQAGGGDAGENPVAEAELAQALIKAGSKVPSAITNPTKAVVGAVVPRALDAQGVDLAAVNGTVGKTGPDLAVRGFNPEYAGRQTVPMGSSRMPTGWFSSAPDVEFTIEGKTVALPIPDVSGGKTVDFYRVPVGDGYAIEARSGDQRWTLEWYKPWSESWLPDWLAAGWRWKPGSARPMGG